MKILSANSDKKKTLALIVSTEAEVKKPRRGERPLSTRRAAVFATNLYERTAEGLFRCKECGKEAKLQTNIRKHLRKHTGQYESAFSSTCFQLSLFFVHRGMHLFAFCFVFLYHFRILSLSSLCVSLFLFLQHGYFKSPSSCSQAGEVALVSSPWQLQLRMKSVSGLCISHCLSMNNV